MTCFKCHQPVEFEDYVITNRGKICMYCVFTRHREDCRGLDRFSRTGLCFYCHDSPWHAKMMDGTVTREEFASGKYDYLLVRK